MAPLVSQLAARGAQHDAPPAYADPGAAERVAAGRGLLEHGVQVGIDGRERPAVRAEPLELRVVAVAARAAPQHRARQQRLAPQRHQAARIEVAGMYGPEPHGRVQGIMAAGYA